MSDREFPNTFPDYDDKTQIFDFEKNKVRIFLGIKHYYLFIYLMIIFSVNYVIFIYM